MTRQTEPELAARGPQAAIIAAAIRFRGALVALSFILLAYGTLAVTQAHYDVFPEFAPPQVGIQTEAPGLSPEDIEALVSQTIENSIAGVAGVRTLRSSSIQGLSVVTVTFDNGSDIYRDRQVVAERLSYAATQLPAGVHTPTITPLTSSSSTVLVAGLTSRTRDLMDVRTAADWTVKLRLLAVPGVAKVAVFGGAVRALEVKVSPDALVRHNIGLDEVSAAVRRATAVRGAGFLDTPNQRIALRSEGQATTVAALGDSTIGNAADGVALALKDVATIAEAPEPRIGAASVGTQPGVVLVVSGQYGANTVEVTKAVEAALASLRPGLAAEGIDLDATLFRPANFIGVATGGVRDALLLGGLFVVVVLFVFLFDLRTAAISSLAIPLSLLAAVIVLNACGVTLNTMTLGGLAIAIGEVVDDAVIDVENIVRRLRENRAAIVPRPAASVVLAASLEVRSAVVYATFTVLLVFLPIVTLPGIAGRFFAPLGIAYSLALLASLAVALTVTPALCMLLLGSRRADPDSAATRPPPLVRWSRPPYERLLRRVVERPVLAMAAAGLTTLGGVALLPLLGNTFLPTFKEGHYTLHLTALPGTSLDETARLGQAVGVALTKVQGVRAVSQRVGRAESADDTWGPNYSEMEVDLQPGLSGHALIRADGAIRAALLPFPGLTFSLKPFLTERVEETLSGASAPVAVNIFGNDLDKMDGAARQVAAILATVPGGRDVQMRTPAATPELSIRLRDDALRQYGFSRVDVLDAVHTAYAGDVAGQVYLGHRALNVITTLAQAGAAGPETIGALPLRAANGRQVPLRLLADIRAGDGRYEIDHLGAQRLQSVTADVPGGDVAGFVAAARNVIAAKVKLPAGLYLDFAGSADAQARSRRDLALHSALAFAGILLILAVITRSARNLALVLANVPFALVGGVAAVFATGATLSIGSLVGFVALFGISLRNSIMMIAHYDHLVAVERRPWGRDTAIAGAADRLLPIVMTTLVTALGLLPLALGLNEPGREIQGPMAIVILGGLATSMTLNLLILPTLALRFARFQPAVA